MKFPFSPRFPLPVHDKTEGRPGGDFGALPEWDLSDLYPTPDGPEITDDLDWLEGECSGFALDYEGKLEALDGDALLECIQRYERIQTIAGRIMSFAGLGYY